MEMLPASLRKMEQMLPEAGPIWPKPLPRFTGAKGMDAVFVALQNAAILGKNGESSQSSSGRAKHAQDGRVLCRLRRQRFLRPRQSDGDRDHGGLRRGCVYAAATRVLRGDAQAWRRTRSRAPAGAGEYRPVSSAGGTAIDYIVTNIAGCGSTLMEYDVLLRDDPEYAPLAAEFRRRYRDISQMLAELTLPEMKHPVNLTAAYQDACHLAHAQRVRQGPRDLLARIPGLTLVPLAESDLCCGAAGMYNLEQPETANDLADRKLDNVAAAKVEVLITGNAGCAAHLAAQAKVARAESQDRASGGIDSRIHLRPMTVHDRFHIASRKPNRSRRNWRRHLSAGNALRWMGRWERGKRNSCAGLRRGWARIRGGQQSDVCASEYLSGRAGSAVSSGCVSRGGG